MITINHIIVQILNVHKNSKHWRAYCTYLLASNAGRQAAEHTLSHYTHIDTARLDDALSHGNRSKALCAHHFHSYGAVHLTRLPTNSSRFISNSGLLIRRDAIVYRGVRISEQKGQTLGVRACWQTRRLNGLTIPSGCTSCVHTYFCLRTNSARDINATNMW